MTTATMAEVAAAPAYKSKSDKSNENDDNNISRFYVDYIVEADSDAHARTYSVIAV
jgi:hypothetical protein